MFVVVNIYLNNVIHDYSECLKNMIEHVNREAYRNCGRCLVCGRSCFILCMTLVVPVEGTSLTISFPSTEIIQTCDVM